MIPRDTILTAFEAQVKIADSSILMIYDTIAEFESAKPEYAGLVELSILGWLEQYGENIAIVVSDSWEDAKSVYHRYTQKGYRLLDENPFGNSEGIAGVISCYQLTVNS